MQNRSASLETIVAEGNRFPGGVFEPSLIVCGDGFMLSVIAGAGAQSSRGGDGFATVEVGFPSERPEPWSVWESYAEDRDNPTETVYGWVPVGTVEALIVSHGGAR